MPTANNNISRRTATNTSSAEQRIGVELSTHGFNFLTSLFTRFDSDKDGVLLIGSCENMRLAPGCRDSLSCSQASPVQSPSSNSPSFVWWMMSPLSVYFHSASVAILVGEHQTLLSNSKDQYYCDWQRLFAPYCPSRSLQFPSANSSDSACLFHAPFSISSSKDGGPHTDFSLNTNVTSSGSAAPSLCLSSAFPTIQLLETLRINKNHSHHVKGLIGIEAWLSLWSLFARTQPHAAARALCLLGYPHLSSNGTNESSVLDCFHFYM